jgi:ribose transport system substrate-binding protein
MLRGKVSSISSRLSLERGPGDRLGRSGENGMSGTAVRPAFALLLLALSENKVLGTGPNGESPTPAVGFELSYEELEQVKKMNATAAIVMHYGGNDWAQAQIEGLHKQFGEMSVEVIAVTDAGFQPQKQVSDIEMVLAQKPNVIVSIPTDPVATADAYLNAVSQGVKLVFMDNVPVGMKAGEDYVSVVSADNFGNGVASAHLMAQALDAKGTMGIVFHEADFFVTRQRYEAFKQTIQETYPGIEIVDEQGIGGPEFARNAEKGALALLTDHPDLQGVWAVWDVLAEGVIAAARAAGRDDLVITTIDLGRNVAMEIAQGGLVYGLGAQRPFDQGVNEAELAAYGLLGKDAPAYVALPALPVTKANVLAAWESVYRTPAPPELEEAAV